MTIVFRKGRYNARFALGTADVLACQRLRHQCFFETPGVDADRFDALFRHLMIEDPLGRIVAAVRFVEVSNGAALSKGYAAQFYDLAGLADMDAPMIEIGRFCVAPDVLDVDVLRVAWGALTQLVDATGVQFLFGCSSFAGTDPDRYGQAFARLTDRHLGPAVLRPATKTTEVVALASVPPVGADPMPSLLRTYLAMGGWVGDQLVVDRQMQTMHVFTCLEVAAVPPSRARALRALAPAP